MKKGLVITNVLALRGCGHFSHEDWLRVELRAGWGREDNVSEVLKRFAKRDPQIIADAVMSVAGLCSDDRPLPSWVIHGIAEAADSCTAKDVKQSLAGHVNDCNDNFCKVFVRVAMRLPDTTIFLKNNPMEFPCCLIWQGRRPEEAMKAQIRRSPDYSRRRLRIATKTSCCSQIDFFFPTINKQKRKS